ncbi:MAG: TIGR03000 domain-containing protein [Gemmataceae bacterium]
MYSVILLMAVTTGGETADFGCRRACGGCGCSCYVSCGGCYSCGGCTRVRGCRKHACHGCYTCHSCYSCVSYSCGCAAPVYGCTVSYGCAAPVCHGCTVSYGCTAPVYGCTVSYGCTAPVISGCTATVGCAGGHLISSVDVGTTTGVAATESSNTATIIVNVPSQANVTIDGTPTQSTSEVRYFESPSLKAGQTYSYTIEASFQKDGAPVKVSKQVSFSAGKTVRVDFASGAAVASK